MTQPIQEPTTQRSLSRLTWQDNQLFRRPGPVTGAFQSTFWRGHVLVEGDSVAFAEPDFDGGTDLELEYINDGRWSVDGNGRFVLSQAFPGMYEVGVLITDFVAGGAVDTTIIRVLMDAFAPQPGDSFWLPGWFDTATITGTVEFRFLCGTNNLELRPDPAWARIYLWDPDEDLTIRLRCTQEDDGVQVTQDFDLTLFVNMLSEPNALVPTLA